MGVGVEVAVTAAVGLGVSVRVAVAVAVGNGVGVFVAVAVGVAVGMDVAVGNAVAVGAGVAVGAEAQAERNASRRKHSKKADEVFIGLPRWTSFQFVERDPKGACAKPIGS